MGKQTKKKKSTGAAKEIFAKPPGRLGKWNVIAFVVLVIGELIYYYAATPAINIQSTSFCQPTCCKVTVKIFSYQGSFCAL